MLLAETVLTLEKVLYLLKLDYDSNLEVDILMFLWIKMRAYSQDLRNRSISHYNTGKYQIKDLEKTFSG